MTCTHMHMQMMHIHICTFHLWWSYRSFTKHRTTHNASCKERSASSITRRFEPRTRMETVLPGFLTPVIFTSLPEAVETSHNMCTCTCMSYLMSTTHIARMCISMTIHEYQRVWGWGMTWVGGDEGDLEHRFLSMQHCSQHMHSLTSSANCACPNLAAVKDSGSATGVTPSV